MKKTLSFIFPLIYLLLASCSSEMDRSSSPPKPQYQSPVTYKYLALGDSYTIGESVCETCRFPEQLKARLQGTLPNTVINLSIIAQTGWTTTNLKAAIIDENPTNDHDLVTLLIGVNNQFQNKPFSLYQQEFPELLDRAIILAKGDYRNVVVISIPDYRYTPFGNNLSNPENVSSQIDQYNTFARGYCLQRNVQFVDITDITRSGLNNPALVAEDGLHPSEFAYSEFVVRILPKASSAIMD